MDAAMREFLRIEIAAAVADERRRCAWIADQYATGDEGSETACRIADEIRSEEKTDAERRAVGKRDGFQPAQVIDLGEALKNSMRGK